MKQHTCRSAFLILVASFLWVPVMAAGFGPTVTNVAPSSGSIAGGTTVIITGTNFTNITAVTFGGTAATSHNVDGATQITAVTPAHVAGAVSVEVTNNDGTNAANTFFTYSDNSAPVITSNGGGATGTVNVAENTTAVTTVVATDTEVPATQTLTYSISGTDAGLFTINSSSGVLSFSSAPNYESPSDAGNNNVYNVTVIAMDDGTGTLSDSQDLTVTVTDVNEAPVITSNGGGATGTVTVAENTTAVTTVTATDAEVPATQTLTYSISGTDAGLFTINSSSGVLSFSSAPNYESPSDAGNNNVYDVTVIAKDDGTGTLSDSQDLTVTVTDVNEAPTLAAVSKSGTEDTTVTFTAADFTGAYSDPDSNPLNSITVVSLPATGNLKLSGTNVTASQVISAANLPNLTYVPAADENGAKTFTVTASDGTASSTPATTVTMTLAAVNDVPSFALTDTVTVAEDAGAQTIASVASSIFAGPANESAQTVSFTVTNTNNGLFSAQPAIASNGTLTFTSAADANGSATVSVTATDSSGASSSPAQTFTITVTAVNDAPVITSNGGGATGSISIAENTTAVTTVTATDVEVPATQSLTYSKSGPDADLFSIVPATGVLTFNTAPNYESPGNVGGVNVYNVTVTARDNGTGTLSDSQNLAVTVTDVNDAPIITSNGGGATGTVNVAENTTSVTTVTATDADVPAQTLTYSISGTDVGFFTINSSSGALTFTTAPNFENKVDAGGDNVYNVIVTATDNGSGTLSDSQSLAVTVTDVNDAPIITSNGGGATGTVNVAENTTSVTTVTATDADVPAQTLTYSKSGTDAAFFTIDGGTGVLAFAVAPNYEIPLDAGGNNVYNVTVTATDNGTGTLSDSQDLAITVTFVSSGVAFGSGTTTLTGENPTTGAATIGSGGSLILNGTAGANTTFATDGTAGNTDITLSGGTLQILQSEQIGDNAGIVLDSGAFNFGGASGLTETIGTFTNNGGTFSTGANTLIGTGNTITWAGGTNTVNNGGIVQDEHIVITGGTNTVEGGATGGVLRLLSGGTGLEMSNGSTLTLNSDNAVAGRLLLEGDVSVTGNATVTIASGLALGNSGNIVLSGTRTFTVANGGAADDLLVSAIITAGALEKAGAGTMTLSGANTYTSTTAVTAGTLSITGSINSTTTIVVSGGELSTSGTNKLADSAFVLIGGGTLTIGGDDTVGSLTLNSGTIGGTATLTAGTYDLGGGTVTGNLGSGTINSSGTVALNGTAAAETVNVTAGALTLGASSAINSATVVAISGGSLTLGASNQIGDAAVTLTGGGTLDIGGFNDTVGAVTLTSGSITGSGGVLTGSSYAVADGSISAILGGSGIALTKTTGGTVTLSGANTYTGTTTVSGGTLSITGSINSSATLAINGGELSTSGADKLADTAAVTVGGGTLTIGGDDTVGSLTLTSGTIGGSATLAAATYGLQGGAVDGNLGSGILTKSTTGTVTLNGTAAAATVNIGAGTLTLGVDDRLVDGATVTVSGTGILDLGTFTDTVTTFNMSSGSITGSGTLTAGTYGLSGGTVTANLGGGTINSSGTVALNGTAAAETVNVTAGALTLGASSAINSATVVAISGGSLNLGASNQIGDAAVTVSGTGTLALGSNSDTVASVSLTGTGSITGTGVLTSTAAYDMQAGSVSAILGGTAGLNKTTAGTVTLSGANTYTGTTQISAGTLALSGAGALSDSTAVNLTGATGVFDISGITASGETIGSLAGVASSSVVTTGKTLTAGGTNANTTFAGVISGLGGALTKAGTGELILSGANSYSGNTTIDGGAIFINHATAIGSGALVAGATARIDNTSGSAITLSNNNNVTLSGGSLTFTGSNNLSFGSGVLTISGSNRTITANGGVLTFGGLDAAGSSPTTRSLTKSGTGTLVITGAAGTDFQGGFIHDDGTLILGDKASLGTGALTMQGGILQASTDLDGANALTVSGWSLAASSNFSGNSSITLGNSTVGMGASRSIFNDITAGKALTLGAFAISSDSTSQTLTISGSGATTVNGVISNGGTSTGSALTKNGTGVLTLTAANTYAGATTITAGTLALSGAGALSDSSAVNLNGLTAVFDISNITAAGESVGSLEGVASSSVVLGAKTLTAGGNNGTTSFAGVISGTDGSLTKAGTGSLTLSGTNIFTGTTTVSAGTLSITGSINNSATIAVNGGLLSTNGANKLADAAAVTVSGGTLTVGGADTVGTLTTSGSGSTIGGSATLTALTYALGGTSTTVTGNLGAGTINSSGTVALNGTAAAETVNVTAGALTLGAGSAINSATVVAISGGSLTLGASNQIGNAAVTVSSTGTLALGTNSDTVASVSLTGTGSITGSTGVLTSTAAYDMQAGSVSAVLGGTAGLNKTTAGTVTLSGANTYTGTTQISAGTLALSGSGALSNSSSVVVTGGTFDIGSVSDTVAGVQLASGSITGTSGVLTSSSTYDVRSGDVSAILGGTVGLTKTTTGTVTLTGANTYTGLSTVSAGILNIRHATALGTTAGGTSVSNGATLQLQGGITVGAEALTLNGGAASGETGALVNASGTNTYGGAITVAASSSISAASGSELSLTGGVVKNGTTATFNGGGTINVGTVGISGASANSDLIIDGATVNLNVANTYNGPTIIRNSGTLNANVVNALPTANGRTAVSFDGSGTSVLTLGAAQSVASLTSAGVATITLDTNTLTVGTSAGSTTFAGTIGGTGGLTKDGASTLVLSGSNTYTGLTDVQAGTLSFGASAVIADTASVRVSGGTLAVGTFSDTVAGVQLTSGSITGSSGVLTSTSAYDMQAGSVSAILSGAVGLNKTTTSTVTLTGANLYTGLTAVSAGVLNIQNASALGTVAAGTSVASGAALELQGGITTLAEALTLNGTGVSNGGALRNISGSNDFAGLVTLGGAARINSDAGTLTLSNTGTITGSGLGLTVGGSGNTVINSIIGTDAGSLTKDGSGTLTLTGANTFTGATAISAGTLQVSGSLAAGSTVAVATGGTLTGAGTVNGNATLTGNGVINLTNPGVISGTLGVTGGNWNGAGSVTGLVTSSSGTFTIGSGANLTANGNLNVTGGSIASGNSSSTITGSVNYTSASDSSFGGVIAGSSKTVTMNNASATLTLGGTSTYTGATQLTAGNLVINGSIATTSLTTVDGGTLQGTGTVSGIQLNSGGAINAGLTTTAGTLNTGSIAIVGGQLQFNLGGDGAGQYDQLNTTGAIDLGAGGAAAKLVLDAISGYVATLNDAFTLVSNDLVDAITGQFAKVNTSGTNVVTISGVDYVQNVLGSNYYGRINYAGDSGDPVTLATAGNDIVLKIVTPEITVTEGATTLTDNGGYDFGDVDKVIPAIPLTKTFTIKNDGEVDLMNIAITTLTGVAAGDYSLNTTGTATNLIPGASTTFTVTFNPQRIGTRNAYFSITSNDLNEATFDIPLTGVGSVGRDLIADGAAATDSWAVTYSGVDAPTTKRNSVATAVAVQHSPTADEAVAVFATGYTTNAAGNKDIYLMKYNPNSGAEMWASPVIVDGGVGGDDEAFAIAVDGSGNVVVAGYQTASLNNTDVYVAKFNGTNGASIWTKTYSGAGGGYDMALSLALDSSGNVAVAGNGRNAAANQDVFVARYLANGTEVFAYLVDGGASRTDGGNTVATDSAGNVYAAGYRNVTAGNKDCYIIKLDSTGGFVWERTIAGTSTTTGSDDEVYSMALDASGNPVLGGTLYNSTGYDLFAAELNAGTGAVTWQKSENPYGFNDSYRQVLVDRNGNIIMAGVSHTTATTTQRYVSKYTTDGVLVWNARMNSANSSVGNLWSGGIALDGEENVVVTGFSVNVGGTRDVYTAKLKHRDGSQIWERTYDGGVAGGANDEGRAVASSLDGYVYVAGYAGVDGGTTAFLLKHYKPLTAPVQTSQSISFPVVTEQGVGGSVQLVATATSGLRVRFNVISGPGTLGGPNNDVLTISGTGTVVVRASQSGNYQYAPAANVQQSLVITRQAQTITFTLPASTYYTNTVALGATASSGLAVTYTEIDDPSGVATVAGSNLTFTGPGFVTVRASQAGNGTYIAAPDVDVTIQATNSAPVVIPAGIAQRWMKSYAGTGAGVGRAVALTPATGAATAAVMTGYTTTASGGRDIYTVQYSVDGTFAWQAVYSGAGAFADEGVAVTVDGSGNVYVAGYTTVSGSDTDLIVIKYNSSGAQQWVRTYSGTATGGADAATSLALLGSDVVVAGYLANSSRDYFAARINSANVEAWAYSYDPGTIEGSTSKTDTASKVAVDHNGNIALLGNSAGANNVDDIWTVKLNSSGIRQWYKRYNGTLNREDRGNGLGFDNVGNVLISGWTNGQASASTYDIYVAKYAAADGALAWQTVYNHSDNLNDSGRDLTVDSQGNAIVVGVSNNLLGNQDMWTGKFNGQTGVLAWADRYNNVRIDQGVSVSLDPNGNVIATGSSGDIDGTTDIYTVKYTNAGSGVGTGATITWTQRYEGLNSRNDAPSMVAADGAGSVYVAGYQTNIGGVTEALLVRYAPPSVTPPPPLAAPPPVAMDESGEIQVLAAAAPPPAMLQLTLDVEHGDPAQFEAEFADAEGNDTVAFSAVIDGNPGGTLSIDAEAGRFTWEHDTTTIAPGPHEVIITATDTAGASTSVNLSMTVSSNHPDRTWRWENFGSTVASGNAADDADPDGDGLANLAEFAFGLDPTRGSSDTGSRAEVSGGQGGMRAVFRRRKDHATSGLEYGVEFSSNLGDWTPSSVVPEVIADEGVLEKVGIVFPVLPNGQQSRFFRINVQQQNLPAQ